LFEGKEQLLNQIEKDQLLDEEKNIVLSALKEADEFSGQMGFRKTFVFPQLYKNRIITYRINLQEGSAHERWVTRFYPVGETEEYTDYPYKPMQLKNVTLKGPFRGRRYFSKFIKGINLYFNRIESRKEAILKSSNFLEGRHLVAILNDYHQLLNEKDLDNLSDDQRALLDKLKFKEGKLVEGIWEVDDAQASFKHFFEKTEWPDPAKDHYPKDCQPQFIPVAPPLKAKE